MIADAAWAVEISKAAPYVLGAIVGGGSTIVGVVVAQLLTHRYTVARDTRSHQRESLLDYVRLLSADAHWLDQFRRAYCFGSGEGPAEQEPWGEAFVLSLLFLEFTQIEIPFMEARMALIEAIGKVKGDRLEKVTTGAAVGMNGALPNQALLNAVKEAYQKYLEAKKNVLAAASLSAKSLASKK